jgi:anti-sigma regulatory factor (Ser/Thr protein kinase)
VAHLPLPDNVHAPRLARRFLRDLIERWAMPGLLEPLTLAVSELVTNAVRHGRPPIRLSVCRQGEAVRIEVQDAGGGHTVDLSRAMPLPRDDRRGGRGLILVRSVSAKIGVDPAGEDGKRIWAVVEPAPLTAGAARPRR